MGLFKRKTQEIASPEMPFETQILVGLRTMMEKNGGDFVSAADLCLHLEVMAIDVHLGSHFEHLRSEGLVERGKNVHGFWGDRLTGQGDAQVASL